MGRLFWKILLTFWLTLLVTGGITGAMVWMHHNNLQEMEKDVVIRPHSVIAVKAAANTFLYGGTPALRNMLQEQKDEAPRDLQVYAVDSNGAELLGRTVSADTLERVRIAVTQNLKLPIVRSVQSGAENYVLFAPVAGQFPQFRQENQLRPPRHFPPSFMIVSGIVVSFISSFLLAWYFSQPVSVLRKAFGAVAKGDFSQRVTPSIGKRRDEIADLGRAFDEMTSQLQNLMASQRRLLHDVSHELRSPLARLQVSVGLARQQPEKIASSLDRIEHEAERLDTLVGEVLTLSRLESGVPQPLDEYIDILELLDAVIDDARFEADAMGRQVVFQADVDDLPLLQGRGELLYRALENVVRNAIHHTPTNTSVNLSIHRQGEQLQINVDDQGTGVPETELDSIFEAFQRSSAGSANRHGYGLGLAIARRAIESHGGSIHASNRTPQGLRIRIRLPLKWDA
ncbi:MAG TPA: ATP-binding protein [Candidatus Thiothrix moscowensis]|uniref:ATP-binding protein n=1 Tax=unclassified Thiothrix TaxID=2636184 RepID=UPI0025E95DEC|nr:MULTISPECIES: ATP-binding protein [unclassified Thiothrix]HRJ53885.1 ATP-binding protein [Candidatus Thiothrix moscowensis]HRJ93967.1 ATP-binding protein [Candidatus Thiothrix moscowensis]